MITIIKRNGKEVPFDKRKIINAINKAFIEVDGKVYEYDTSTSIASNIEEVIKELEETLDIKSSVESIQDMVEYFLMTSERQDVARAYIRYRYKREVARTCNKEFIEAFAAKINATNIENQNANVDEISFGGRVGAASDLQMKKYALDFCVSDMARKNHENNEIYIHDLSAYAVGSHNCLTIPFDDLLANGFNTRQTDVRPAGSVNTAFQLVAVIFQLQSLQQFGGVSAGHLDWTMVPYVRKNFYKHFWDGLNWVEQISKNDQILASHYLTNDLPINDEEYMQFPKAYAYAMAKTEQEIHQAVEGMYHNLNTLQSRSGNQLKWVAG